jgi:multidrug efflux system outer membrane protein
MPFAPHSQRKQQGLARARGAVRAAGACTVAALLAACTLGPDYKRPELPLPTSYRSGQPVAAAASSASAPGGAVVSAQAAADLTNTAWWQAFGDADLTALVNAALESNRDLRIAAYRVQEYDARLQVSAADAYPHAQYSLSGERKKRSQEEPELLRPGTPPNYNEFSVGMNFGWEVDVWGRIKRANEAARAELLSTEEARRAVMLTVVTDVANGYVQLLGLDQQLAIARRTLKNRQDAVDLLTKKYQGGSATKLSVSQAQALVDEVSATIPDLERQITFAENALCALLGRNPGPIPRRSIEQLSLPAVPAGVPSDVLTRRPDVQQAEQTLVAANARIGVAKAEFFPTISLTGALGLASDDLRWLLAKTARTGEITRSITGPLFDGGKASGDLREAEAIHNEMVETYLKSIQTALQEVDNALVYTSKARERLDALSRQVGSREDVRKLAQLRFEGGESTYLEVLDAERELYAAQNLQAEGKRDEYLALVSVYKAMGGGWMVEQDKLRAGNQASAPAQVAAAATKAPTGANQVEMLK